MLEGKRIAILAEQDFEDAELTEPLQAMKAAGARVTVVGSGTQKSYKGKRGAAEIKVDADADQVGADDFDAVIIPGGYAPDKMRLHKPMVDLVRKMHDSGKVVAAICHGPQLMISAEIVRGRRVTSWPSVAIDLKNAGAVWVDEPVVRDGNLITSRQPADIPEFNRAIVQTLVWRKAPGNGMAWAPAVEIYEKENNFVVKADLPGVKKEDVDVSVIGDTLTIKGERKASKEVKDEDYYRCETHYGSFSRSITLPAAVDPKKVEASYEDGILEIQVPKAKEAMPAKVEIKVK